MKRTGWKWTLGVVLAALLVGGVGPSRGDDAGGLAGLTGDLPANLRKGSTLPFKEYKICAPTMGVIREVKVKEGDVLKKGDVIMVQDDREERAELKLLELDCTDIAIKAAEQKAEAAEADFKGKDRLHAGDGKNELEWIKARAEWEVAKYQIDQAKQELQQKIAKRDKQRTHVENMTLRAPSDGIVKELINDIGSNVDPTKQVITLVQNNPLLVQVQVPALASLQLKRNDKLRVSYDRVKWREASVSFLSPEADAGSGGRNVQLELPNPDGEPSGLKVYVELPEKLLAASADAK